MCVCNVQAKQFMIVKNCLKTQVVPYYIKKRKEKIKESEIASRFGSQLKLQATCAAVQVATTKTAAAAVNCDVAVDDDDDVVAASCDLLFCMCLSAPKNIKKHKIKRSKQINKIKSN